jgi:hypothetical protein
VSLLGVFAAIGVVAVAYLTGDYVRIQLLRGQSMVFMRSLSVERDKLKDSNQTLKSQLNVLAGEQERVDGFERQMRDRLEALRSVISSVEALSGGHSGQDIMGAPKLLAKAESKKGIGGAELDCHGGDIKCSGVLLDGDENELTGEAAGADAKGALARFGERLISPFRNITLKLFSHRKSPQEQLVDEMDKSIEALRVLPLASPGNAEITSEYGYRKSPFTGRRALHEGMDFSLQPGSPAMVTADGIVKDVRFHPTYGLVIDIEHTPRVVTRYAHLRKALVRRGERVSRGETVGLVGSTGRSTGPHLHYEVRIDGEPHNPEDLIALGQRLSDIF